MLTIQPFDTFSTIEKRKNILLKLEYSQNTHCLLYSKLYILEKYSCSTYVRINALFVQLEGIILVILIMMGNDWEWIEGSGHFSLERVGYSVKIRTESAAQETPLINRARYFFFFLLRPRSSRATPSPPIAPPLAPSRVSRFLPRPCFRSAFPRSPLSITVSVSLEISS